MTASAPVRITSQAGETELSSPQKQFNTLVQQIAAQRQLLGDWQQAMDQFQQRRARELDPLLEAYDGVRAELALCLDHAYAQKGLSKADRQHLAGIIRALAATLIRGSRAASMQALHDKYSDAEEASERQPSPASTPAADDEIDMDSPEALQRAWDEAMQAEQARMDHIAAEKEKHRARHRQKSAQALQQQAAEKDASQSLREVYRKLASALHPDRETDPTERLRKTALMQRVNQAYAQKNLLDMLQLQIEAEQIDPQRMADLNAERLRHYNQVLAEQLRELQQEIRDTEADLRARFGIEHKRKFTPASIPGLLREHVAWLMQDIQQIKSQMFDLDELKTLKLWIRTQVQYAAFDALDD